MSNMTASIPHQLTRTEAKRRIQEQMGKLRQQQGAMLTDVQESWNEDRLDFKVRAMGQEIAGHLVVDDRVVNVEVALPWMLSMLAGAVKQKIEQQGVHLLSNQSSSDRSSGS